MIEQFNAATNEKKLELLGKAETYINAIWPVAQNNAHLQIEKNEKEQSVKKEYENISGGKAAVRLFLIISAVLAFLWLILPEGLLKFLAIFCLIPSILMTIVSFFLAPGYKKTYEATAARLRELESLIAASEKELDAVKQQHMDGFSIWYTFCRECKSPRDMRAFVQYFESGRADTLKEAKNLLAQEHYQNRIESLSKEQIAASEAARLAADRAASAAASAASAASAAAVSSNATWWEVKRNS